MAWLRFSAEAICMIQSIQLLSWCGFVRLLLPAPFSLIVASGPEGFCQAAAC